MKLAKRNLLLIKFRFNNPDKLYKDTHRQNLCHLYNYKASQAEDKDKNHTDNNNMTDNDIKVDNSSGVYERPEYKLPPSFMLSRMMASDLRHLFHNPLDTNSRSSSPVSPHAPSNRYLSVDACL